MKGGRLVQNKESSLVAFVLIAFVSCACCISILLIQKVNQPEPHGHRVLSLQPPAASHAVRVCRSSLKDLLVLHSGAAELYSWSEVSPETEHGPKMRKRRSNRTRADRSPDPSSAGCVRLPPRLAHFPATQVHQFRDNCNLKKFVAIFRR